MQGIEFKNIGFHRENVLGDFSKEMLKLVLDF
jgi:hypothetical protein